MVKKLLKIIITFTAIGVAVKVISKKDFEFTVTDQDDFLLADITNKNIIFRDDVKVHFNGELVD